MKNSIYITLFLTSFVLGLLALISLCISTRTSAHYVSGGNITSLISSSLRFTHAIPGRTFISIPPGLSTTQAEPAAWIPRASLGPACWQFDLPLWLPAAACACAALGISRRAFASPGLCARCKYNLSGLQNAQRCPECGQPIPAVSHAAPPVLAPC